MGKFIGYIIVWVVGLAVFLGLVMTRVTNSWGRGGHPIVIALVLGVICLIVSALLGMRKPKEKKEDIKDNY